MKKRGLYAQFRANTTQVALGDAAADAGVDVPSDPISVDRLAREHIQRVLNDNDGNVSANVAAQAAETAGSAVA